MKLLLHSKSLTVQPLKFGNGQVILSHTLLGGDYIFIMRLKLIRVSKKAPGLGKRSRTHLQGKYFVEVMFDLPNQHYTWYYFYHLWHYFVYHLKGIYRNCRYICWYIYIYMSCLYVLRMFNLEFLRYEPTIAFNLSERHSAQNLY